MSEPTAAVKNRLTGRAYLCCLLILSGSASGSAQDVTVTGRAEFSNAAAHGKTPDQGNVVVWLTPLASSSSAGDSPRALPQHLRLVQKNKSFDPHVLVATVGSVVEFPNRDPFFHNVFSLFEGKRFDLGLYEAGHTRSVHFDRPGICYIFCNIHPQMSAVVLVVTTPYYGISDNSGYLTIPKVPAGSYQLRVWDEGALPEALKNLNREITVSETARSLGSIRLNRAGDLRLVHKNKYGRDYENPVPSSTIYNQP